MTIDKQEQFEAAVVTAFSPLQFKYGLHHTKDRNGFLSSVSFKNDKTYLNVIYGPPAYEIEIYFGRIGIDDSLGGNSFTIGNLLETPEFKDWRWTDGIKDPIGESLHEYARLLDYHGDLVFSANPGLYEYMARSREARVADWQQEEKIIALRSQIDYAWKRSDYEEVIRLYDQIGGNLTARDEKILEICRNSLNKT